MSSRISTRKLELTFKTHQDHFSFRVYSISQSKMLTLLFFLFNNHESEVTF